MELASRRTSTPSRLIRGLHRMLTPFPTSTAMYRRAFLPVNPTELLVIHDQPLAFEHDDDPAIAKAAAIARNFTHGNTVSTMVWRAFTPDRHWIHQSARRHGAGRAENLPAL